MKRNTKTGYYPGKQVMVHAYKFNGWLYRTWEDITIIETNDDYIVCAGKDTSILSSEYESPRVFRSFNKNQIFWVFFKNEWYNILINIINDKANFYINVASRFVYEEGTIKYIDFDLDYKIKPNGAWTILDQKELVEAIEKYHYPEVLEEKIQEISEKIERFITNGELLKTYNQKKINKYIGLYTELGDKNYHEK